MNKNLTMLTAVVALVGLIVNVAVDLDNVYDMTLAALWLIVLLLVLASMYMGMKKQGPATEVKPAQ